MIYVTKPYLPDIDKFYEKIKQIWESNHLTNDGPLNKVLEKKLANYLDIEDLCLINNCTNGLLMGLNEFESDDEIITTPFSFVATTSSIVWSKLKPVFCDIDKDFLFIDVDLVRRLITPKTKAILTTHVFGNTGNIDELEAICKEKNIRLIFDAAHAFGVKYKGKSILKYGDMSVLSFHATKLYHTIEGGAIYCNDKIFMKKMKAVKNFGYENYEIKELGINSKMSEFHSAMGLCNLEEIDSILLNRKKSCEMYDESLACLFDKGHISKPVINPNIEWNYSYYSILFNNESELLAAMEAMKSVNIFPRRYFYPSLNNIGYANGEIMEVSENVSKRIICLPLYYNLGEENTKMISDILLRSF